MKHSLHRVILSVFFLILNGINAQASTPYAILDVEWKPDSDEIAMVYENGLVEVVNTDSEKIVFSFMPDEKLELIAAQIAWDSDGVRLAAGVGKDIYIWNTASYKLIYTLVGGDPDGIVNNEFGTYTEAISTLEWSPDNNLLVGVSITPIQTMWDMTSGNELARTNYGNQGTPFVWKPDGTLLSNGSSYIDPTTLEFTRIEGQHLSDYMIRGGSIKSVSWSPDGNWISYGEVSGYIVVIDANTGNETHSIDLGNSPIEKMEWSPNSHFLAIAIKSGITKIWDITTEEFVETYEINGQLYAVDWNSEGNQIVIAGEDVDGNALIQTLSFPLDDN